MREPGHALVAGASGLVGRNLTAALLQRGWQVTGLARRGGGGAGRHLALDLLDSEACRAALDDLATPTHLFYCARLGSRDMAEEEALNTRMLANILRPLRDRKGLRHVSLVHGTKWYGSHLGPYRTPATEEDPRAPGPNWYFGQYDLVAEWQSGRSWSFSTVRPHIVCGFATDYPYNLITLLGAYGAICRAAGEPFSFPGTEAAFRSVSQATDVELLCRAMIWAASEPGCANESFNVVNADYFRWCNLWPRLAEFFGLADGGVRSRSLAAEAPRLAAIWAGIQANSPVEPHPITALANWNFADFLFRAEWDDMSSTVKLRSFGFQEVVATQPMLLGHLQTLRERRIIP